MANQGIALNGVILISSVLDFQALDARRSNDVPHVLYLPTFAATAWYHKKLAPELQALPLRTLLDQVEAFADGPFQAALDRADALPAADRVRVAEQLSRFLGLPVEFVLRNNLRIDDGRFFAEILRDQGKVVGRFDSRYTGFAEDLGGATPDFDPSYAAVHAPYTTTFNQYVRATLGVKTDTRYNILGSERIGRWDWGPSGRGFPETTSALRTALSDNPHLKVWIASGYYDLATPYRGAAHTRDHLHLPESQRGNIRLTHYEAGHMMYLDPASLTQLKRDAAAFIADADGL